jgi:hypothetical protein
MSLAESPKPLRFECPSCYERMQVPFVERYSTFTCPLWAAHPTRQPSGILGESDESVVARLQEGMLETKPTAVDLVVPIPGEPKG